MSAAGEKNQWHTFWEQNILSTGMTDAIARGYWERLLKVVPVKEEWTGLDFGCGQGHLLRRMGHSLKFVFGIDVSPTMVDISRVTVRGCDNVKVVQAVHPPRSPHQPPFDLIVANSCLQYLSDGELKAWLRWWMDSLSPRGRLVLSDIFPRRSSRRRNFLETLKWGWRQGCLGSVLHEFLLMIRYGYFREFHYVRDPEELLDLIGGFGGDGRLLPDNLDFLSTRDTILAWRID